MYLGRFDESIPFTLKGLPPRRWRLEMPLRFRSPSLHAWVQVPNGFVSDGASVPAWAAWAFPREGRGLRAAIVHDWLYRTGSVLSHYGVEEITQDDADRVYLEALTACDVRWLPRTLAYWAVRIGGGKFWQKYRDEQEERNEQQA